ncbi:MAG: ABC transporter permease [Bifidobacteriaceae bacterium]|jgi:D-methionine transport system permease protein|nr:ABC transporter permease [Bifidobacteriaceae bacterium]
MNSARLGAVVDPGTYFNNEDFTSRIGEALAGTLGQVAVSTLIGVLVGLPLGLAVWYTAPQGLHPTRVFNRALNLVVDLGRAIPFIVLMLLLLSFTRLLLGSTLGWQGGIPALAVGCIPFYARLAENAIRGVAPGKIEAAQMAGASHWQITWGVAVREALPGLVAATTVTFITLIGYSMITGTIGAGGLGDLIYNWGYTRNMTDILVMVVVIVLLLVETVQLLGDWLVRKLDHTR